MIDLKTITPHLTERYAAFLTKAVADLEAAVHTGMVPNKLFTDCKDTFNRAAEQAGEAFLKTGPAGSRDGQPHHQSDWWLKAYDNDAFVRGLHTLPTVIARATKAGMTDYVAFLGALLPIRNLMETAKPLIKKRNELPKVMSAKEIADDKLRMTCQCCERRIHANTGTIAHHGYERPGHGWQTGSCVGAKELPFEVSRDRLGSMIDAWKERRRNMHQHRAATIAETVAITIDIIDRSQPRKSNGHFPTKRLEVTRKNFDELKAAHADGAFDYLSFDGFKKNHVAYQSSQIKELDSAIRYQLNRFNSWKQTHTGWDGDQWVAA